jgi:hypothetical protein
MSRERRSGKQNPEMVVETYGGDYHRLESDFRSKAAGPASDKAKKGKQGKNKRKKAG